MRLTSATPPVLVASVGLGGADLIGAVAAESNEELAAGLEEDFRQMTAAQGRILVRLGEFDRRQGFRDEGATSVEAWTTERFGVSAPTARALAHVGEVAWNLPHLVGALCGGALSFDKVRALADVATPESDAPLCEQANACTVRELADIARTTAEREAAERQAAGRCARARSEHDRRYLRFNDTFRTVTAQLPAESYAEAKACLEAVAREIPSEDEVSSAGENPSVGQTRWDQRLCDAFKEVIRKRASGTSNGAKTASPFFVVAHVALGALVDESGEASELAGELEHDGLIDTETVQKLACDAHLGHSGRRRRRAHHVRGPGPALPDRCPTPRGQAPRPTVSLPGLCQRHLRRRASHRAVETRGSGATWTIWPSCADITTVWCTERLDHDRQRQRGADLLRPDGPGHDVAPFAFVDQGHGRSPVGSVGLRRSLLRLKRAGAARPSGR